MVELKNDEVTLISGMGWCVCVNSHNDQGTQRKALSRSICVSDCCTGGENTKYKYTDASDNILLSQITGWNYYTC